jgi:membrane associated rhomboid family serine protease
MVFPLHDDNTLIRTRPVVTRLLVTLNILVFFLTILQGRNIQTFLAQYAVTPLEWVHGFDMPPTIPFPFQITLLTSLFLHGGLMHVAVNMLFLWVFGDNVEDRLGHRRFLLLYLLCGLGGTALYLFLSRYSSLPSLGASGAISGIMASYLLLFPHNRIKVLVGYVLLELPALAVVGFWILLQLLFGILTHDPSRGLNESSGGTAYSAHLGGFLTGLLLTPLLRARVRS